jgi:outer membrane protein assembly factor BamA
MRQVFKCMITIVVLTGCGAILFSQVTNQSQERNHDGKILVDSLSITGTRTLDSSELAEIINTMAGSEFDNEAEELGERLRAQFQDRGYCQAKTQNLEIKVLDPLASPKTVRLEAEVKEGPLCHLSILEFSGYRALSGAELRAKFPVKLGDVFSRSKIAMGLQSMQGLYGSKGFLDAVFVPDLEVASGAAAKLSVRVEEGTQYRMDELKISGPAEVANKVRARWELAPGAVFDVDYVKTFIDASGSLLPLDFTESSGVELVKNCPEAKVSVQINLGREGQHSTPVGAKSVACSSSGDD